MSPGDRVSAAEALNTLLTPSRASRNPSRTRGKQAELEAQLEELAKGADGAAVEVMGRKQHVPVLMDQMKENAERQQKMKSR